VVRSVTLIEADQGVDLSMGEVAPSYLPVDEHRLTPPAPPSRDDPTVAVHHHHHSTDRGTTHPERFPRELERLSLPRNQLVPLLRGHHAEPATPVNRG
jgi:hypothetical protein